MTILILTPSFPFILKPSLLKTTAGSRFKSAAGLLTSGELQIEIFSSPCRLMIGYSLKIWKALWETRKEKITPSEEIFYDG
jgi:hypothetical protein